MIIQGSGQTFRRRYSKNFLTLWKRSINRGGSDFCTELHSYWRLCYKFIIVRSLGTTTIASKDGAVSICYICGKWRILPFKFCLLHKPLFSEKRYNCAVNDFWCCWMALNMLVYLFVISTMDLASVYVAATSQWSCFCVYEYLYLTTKNTCFDSPHLLNHTVQQSTNAISYIIGLYCNV